MTRADRKWSSLPRSVGHVVGRVEHLVGKPDAPSVGQDRAEYDYHRRVVDLEVVALARYLACAWPGQFKTRMRAIQRGVDRAARRLDGFADHQASRSAWVVGVLDKVKPDGYELDWMIRATAAMLDATHVTCVRRPHPVPKLAQMEISVRWHMTTHTFDRPYSALAGYRYLLVSFEAAGFDVIEFRAAAVALSGAGVEGAEWLAEAGRDVAAWAWECAKYNPVKTVGVDYAHSSLEALKRLGIKRQPIAHMGTRYHEYSIFDELVRRSGRS